MKKVITILIVLFLGFKNIYAKKNEEIFLISVIYNDQNLFIKNSIDKDGSGFAIKSIRLNGELITSSINNEIIKIDFSKYGIHSGDKIEVLINYDAETNPEFIYINNKNKLNNFIPEDWLVKNEKL